MRIRDASVVVCSPGRNFVTLRIETDDGLVGLGDATLNGRELAVAAYLEHHVAPMLIGRDARRIEDTWQLLFHGAYWRGGPVTMAAIGAVDVALWDVRARALGVPLYELLGGGCRDFVPTYVHAFGATIDDAVAAVTGAIARGARAVRVQAAVPGAAAGYGTAGAGERYEPARAGDHPTEERFDAGPYLRFAPELFARLRAAVGRDVALVHDVHHRLTPPQAAQLARALEPHDLLFLEDPVDPAGGPLAPALRLLRAHAATPLATGELFTTPADWLPLVEEGLVDFLRVGLPHAGGVTPMRKLAAVAELHHARLAPHGPSDVSPVGLAATLHFDLAIANLGVQEHMGHPSATAEVFRAAYREVEGGLHPGEAPGLGVDLDLAMAARHPYRRAYLPVARRRDGSVRSW